MKSNLNITPLRTFSKIPSKWDTFKGEGYDKLSEGEHLKDGWRDVVYPAYNSESERLGELYFDDLNEEFIYRVIPIPESELIARKQDLAESERQTKIQAEQEKAITDTFQAIVDEKVLLENQSIYPIWEKLEDGAKMEAGKKYQSFDGAELALFKVIQTHAKQSDWEPIKTPALFSQIKIVAGVEVWTQPIGGSGKYVFGAKVSHKGGNWENTHAAPSLNVWEPGVFGWKAI